MEKWCRNIIFQCKVSFQSYIVLFSHHTVCRDIAPSPPQPSWPEFTTCTHHSFSL